MLLGEGSFGQVYQGRIIAGPPDLVSKRVAIKSIRVRKDKDAQDALAETKLMAKLSHPNIVRLIDARVLSDSSEPTIEIGIQYMRPYSHYAFFRFSRATVLVVQ